MLECVFIFDLKLIMRRLHVSWKSPKGARKSRWVSFSLDKSRKRRDAIANEVIGSSQNGQIQMGIVLWQLMSSNSFLFKCFVKPVNHVVKVGGNKNWRGFVLTDHPSQLPHDNFFIWQAQFCRRPTIFIPVSQALSRRKQRGWALHMVTCSSLKMRALIKSSPKTKRNEIKQFLSLFSIE